MKSLYLVIAAVLIQTFAWGQSAGDYRSVGVNVPWNQASSWLRHDGTSFVAAASPPSNADGVITIMAGTTIKVTSLVTADQIVVAGNGRLTIENGGELIVASSGGTDLVIAVADLDPGGLVTVKSGGVLENQSSITSLSANLKFESGSEYQHNRDGGQIASAQWQSGSTVSVIGIMSTAPSGLGQTFHHFIWACPSQSSSIALNGNLTNISGNLTVGNTNDLFLVLGFTGAGTGSTSIGGSLSVINAAKLIVSNSGTSYTLTVGQDLIVSSVPTTNGVPIAFRGTSTGTVNITVTGNISFESAATSTLVSSTGNATITSNGNFAITSATLEITLDGSSTINATGNFSITNGTVSIPGASGSGTINATGNFTTNNGTIDEQGAGAITINFTGSGTHIFTRTGGTISNTINFVNSIASTLDLGTSSLTGLGIFTNNGTLKVGSTDANGAIQNAPATAGNIQVGGTRTFASSCIIAYTGSGTQVIGNGFPNTGNVDLVIANASNVNLGSNNLTVHDLQLFSGNLTIGANTLTVDGAIAGSGGLVGGSTSNMIIGGSGAFGTLIFSGTNQLKDFTLNRTGSGTVTLGSDLQVSGSFMNNSGTLNFNDRTLRISGPYTTGGGTLTANTASTLLIDGSGSISGNIPFSGSVGTFTLDRATGATLTSLGISNALNLYSGTLTADIDLAEQTPTDIPETIERRDGVLNGTLSATAYHLVYAPVNPITTGPELQTLSLRNFTLNGPNTVTLSQALDVGGVLTISGGSLISAGKAVNLFGNYAKNGGTTNFAGSTLTFDGNTTLSGSSTFVWPDIVITGTLNFGSANVQISGNIDHDNTGGTTVAGTGTVTFIGNTTLTTNTLSIPNFNNVTVSNSSTLAIACSSNCGTEPNQYSINVKGNWNTNNTGAVFTPNISRVVLNGTTQSINMLSTQTFNTLELTGSSSVTLTQALNTTNDLVIGPTASLNTGPGNQQLNLGDDFIINGTFVPNQGTVVFNGSTNQSLNRVSGSGAATKNFYNIHVNKPAARFNVESTVAGTTFRVQNEFRILQNGSDAFDVDFDGPGPANNGILVLGSTSGLTARIPAIPSGADTDGKLTVERYIQNDAALQAYRYFAPPVSGATVADWQGEMPITGTFSNPSTGPGIVSTSPSLFKWVETAGGANRWQAYPTSGLSSAASIDNGRGYLIYGYNNGTLTADVRGTLNEGTVNINLTLTGSEPNAAGYNLVGNPYPAPVDWDLISLPGAISPTISLKNNVDNANAAVGQYIYYTQNGVATGDFSGIIASGQAFYVQTSANNATLAFTESSKTGDANPIVVREAALANVLRIKMYGNDLQDETVVYLRDGATDDFDFKFDAAKRTNDFLNLYTFLGEPAPEKRMAINGLKDVDCSKSIQLGISQYNREGVNSIAKGTYYLNFEEMESFVPAYKFVLVDEFLSKTVEITSGNSIYAFDITGDSTSYGDSRFRILMAQTMDNIFAATANGAASCGGSAVTLTASGAPDRGSYRWYESMSSTVPVSSTSQFTTPVLSSSRSYFVSAVNATGCEGVKVEVNVDISAPLQDANITLDEETLVSNYPEGNQWYFNGEPIEGEVNQRLKPTKSGVYKLVVTQGVCSTSTERQFAITSTKQDVANMATNDLISIYPNPVENKVNIEVVSGNHVTVKLMNALGVVMGETTLSKRGDGTQEGQMDLSTNASGIYILNIQDGDQLYRRKVLRK